MLNHNVKGLTREELEAMSVLLLLAGYDTTASTLAYFLYCMALNPACQEKLYAEVSTLPADKVSDILHIIRPRPIQNCEACCVGLLPDT